MRFMILDMAAARRWAFRRRARTNGDRGTVSAVAGFLSVEFEAPLKRASNLGGAPGCLLRLFIGLDFRAHVKLTQEFLNQLGVII